LIVKDRATGVAESKVVFPAWLAVIEQTPAFRRTAFEPEMVQIVVEFEVKVTGKLEVAEAESGTNAPDTKVVSTGAVKLIV
jgi:hypothetical protein